MWLMRSEPCTFVYVLKRTIQMFNLVYYVLRKNHVGVHMLFTDNYADINFCLINLFWAIQNWFNILAIKNYHVYFVVQIFIQI